MMSLMKCLIRILTIQVRVLWTVALRNIKADTTDESEKTYLSYLTSVMDADRITETGEYVVDPKGILYLTASSSSGSSIMI